jgi:protein-disulfide isomerase
MTEHNHSTQKNYIIAACIIALAVVLQPLSIIFFQANVMPSLAKMAGINTQNPGGQGEVVAKGKTIDNTDLRVRGDVGAKVYLVEFSDLQCPFCERFHPTAKSIVESSNGSVAWVYKHFPLDFHPNALPAAKASECVARVAGNVKHFEFIDQVFTSGQNGSSAANINAIITKLGINKTAYAACLNDATVTAKIQKELAEGQSLGVSGTPGTFIAVNENGKLKIVDMINGALPKETVEQMIAPYLTK